MDKQARIYIAGHRGMVGSAILRKLKRDGFENLIVRSSTELDLRNSQVVEEFFKNEKPEYVFLAAAKVGGIAANDTFSGDFIFDN
ncbi:NAD-dependent epimerase/dehydratase family protein, partial [Xanthovirga aplysinae]|uniref:NAD-dependent epimerase/dehydratase family protein n=1 Tax=Xanthovirga aplysinae TaxID=2529853 RepID=UPI0012BC1019